MTKLTTEQIKRQKALAWLKRVAYENPCMKEVKTCIEVLSAPAQPVIPETTISFYRDGIIAAAKWVENQRDAYDNEHGQSDPDTGAFEFGNNAQLEYSTTLSEIAEGIRSLHPASAQPVSEPYKLPDNLDFDCEFENGDYDIDEEPWLRGRVDGFNEALQIIKRSLNAKQNSTAQESE